jgi:tetratricopeptide (TPR) repeat protein
MDCPRCGAETQGAPECPRCGIVVSKARPPRRPLIMPPPPTGGPVWRSLILPSLGLLALAIAASVYLRRDQTPPAPRKAMAPTIPAPRAPVRALPAPNDNAPLPIASATPALPDTPKLGTAVPPSDVTAMDRLVARLRQQIDLDAEDLRAAEDLYSRYPQKTANLLSAVLLRLASQERRSTRYDAAAARLERALVVTPGSPTALRALMNVRGDLTDWPAVERAARALLNLAPDDAEATRALAYALVRQDRTREAIELLARYLDGRHDSEAATLLARLRKDQTAEARLGQQSLSHFHVRYDGAAHEDVGREVLRVLERHYATLIQTFSHEPTEPIPVILLSEQSYYDSTGAPAWAGGHFDTFDGRIRIPIGGLTTSLDPVLDETVLHELTHAFVTDLSAGVAPRELQEGLAQHVAGHGGAASLAEQEKRALARGQIDDVGGFYLASLALVENLMGQRGQGGINDLLAAMARTRSADAAFQEVYGKDMKSLEDETMARLRQRYGR